MGQLVAESLRAYRSRFWQSLPLGLPVALLTQVGIELSRSGAVRVQGFQPLRVGDDGFEIVVRPASRVIHGSDGLLTRLAGGGVLTSALVAALLLTVSYVAAAFLLSGREFDARLALRAYACGALVFMPAPFLAFFFILPAVAWLAFVGLVVPVVVIERTSAAVALARASRLARADYIHALGSLATLAIVYFLTRLMLFFLLQSAGESSQRVAGFLADLVISPLLFLGAVLLYFDQEARLELRSARERREEG